MFNSPNTLRSFDSSSPRDGDHRHHRRFIGPMPERVLTTANSNTRRKKNKNIPLLSNLSGGQSSDEEDTLTDVIKAHAYQFFIGYGGREEDWSDDQESNIRKEMLIRWQQSDWGNHRLGRGRKTSGSSDKWVGSSFEIGKFLGVDMLANVVPTPSTSPRHPILQSAQPSTIAETIVTAPTHIETPSVDQRPRNSEELTTVSYREENLPLNSASSSTPLLPMATGSSVTRSEIVPPPKVSAPISATKSETNLNGRLITSPRDKGKRKQVHYQDDESAPASPTDVLARTGSEVNETSAGATIAEPQPAKQRNVIMRDRMLVRVSYTKSDSLGAFFDENKNRTTHHLEYEDWAEFMVVWRKERLELYEDHSIPGKEWLVGHKSLAFVIPLNNKRTTLSLYSFVDLTFCLVCPPTAIKSDSMSRWNFPQAKAGSNIFVFKNKSRSRGQDWLWNLWRHLDSHFPPFIEIRAPMIDTRVKVDIPPFDTTEHRNFAVFSRDNVIDLCKRSLKGVKEYEWLMQKAIDEGNQLELAWRMETKLDWVWQFTDVEGKPRDWAVLCGLSLKQGGKPAHLEVRLQEHNSMRLHLEDGTRLDEPLAVEGYLDRVKPNSQLKQPMYLATHDGYLFSIPPNHAFPPNPAGILSENNDRISFRETEVRRGRRQILESTGVSDLRNIVAVRRAFQIIPRHEDMNSFRVERVDDFGLLEPIDRTNSDDEDRGGEENLARTSDRGRRRMRRSFELVLITGQVVRFEAHSCTVALEWINRLRALVTYWRRRHVVDAKLKMDLAYYGTGKPRLTPFIRAHHNDEESPPESPPDPNASLPDLSSIYTWCLIQGCRPILNCGKVFVKKGLRGQYKKVQLVLVAGHLILYLIKPTLSLHHRKVKIINLLDAYVCSGYFAAQTLPEGEFNPDAPPIARRYQDGLETEDPDEDTLLMIWYLQHKVGAGGGARDLRKNKGLKGAAIPLLSAKRKMMLFRTRSKLERDAWCWALNTEIEKIVRANAEREIKLREAGEIIHHG